VGNQIIFEVEQTDHFGLVNQRQAENGTSAMSTDVWIGREGILDRGIVENHTFLSSHDIVDDRLWHRRLGHGCFSRTHHNTNALNGGFRFYTLLNTLREDQQTSLSARMLNRCSHESVDQFLQDVDVTRPFLSPVVGTLPKPALLQQFPPLIPAAS
jgi:hypothetical protein